MRHKPLFVDLQTTGHASGSRSYTFRHNVVGFVMRPLTARQNHPLRVWPIALLLFALLALVVSLFAHPPSEVKIAFDRESGLLRITVEHQSENTEQHFIKAITVKVNRKIRLEHTLIMQQKPSGQEAVYLFTDIVPGDFIEVTAQCNIFGKKSVTLKVTE